MRSSQRLSGTNMEVRETKLQGLWILTPAIHSDNRGFFKEIFHIQKFAEMGIDFSIAQINQSHSQKNVVRGLHFQWGKPLSKIIRVTQGAAYMVAVDIRKRSATLGQWVGVEVTGDNHTILYAPYGFATGFCALSNVDVEYLYSTVYNPDGEGCIAYNDPTVAVAWPATDPIVSDRDKSGLSYQEWLLRPESEIFQ